MKIYTKIVFFEDIGQLWRLFFNKNCLYMDVKALFPTERCFSCKRNQNIFRKIIVLIY